MGHRNERAEAGIHPKPASFCSVHLLDMGYCVTEEEKGNYIDNEIQLNNKIHEIFV